MKRTHLLSGLFIVLLSVPCPKLHAEIQANRNENHPLKVGFYLQTQFISSSNSKADASNDHEEKFNLRRARLRLEGGFTEWLRYFIQVGSDSRDGQVGNIQVIDAFIHLYVHALAQFMMGEYFAPAGRQHLTRSETLMTIDRPGITNYNLTWGLNGGAVFNTASFADGDLDLLGKGNVNRDLGFTLFGSTSLNKIVHIKYYTGLYTGIQFLNDENDKERLTTRLQINFIEPEPYYFNQSTYLGERRTIALGASFDYQTRIAKDLGKDENIDYTWYTFDAFAENRIGPGIATFEAAFNKLHLQDSSMLRDRTTPLLKNALQTQGYGFFIQACYFIEKRKLQPWIAYERWKSDASDNLGSYAAWKFGLTYMIRAYDTGMKIGFEKFIADQRIGRVEDRIISSFVLQFSVGF